MSRSAVRWLLWPMLLWSVLRRPWQARLAVPRRILVAHHLLLGDTLMLAPLLARLRQDYPAAEICVACPVAILPLFAAKPWGVRALPWSPRSAATLWALWRERGFDLALVPGDSRHSWLARALGARHIVAQAGDTPAYKNWWVDEQRPWPTEPTALPDIFAQLAPLLPTALPLPAFQSADWPLAAPRDFIRPANAYVVLHLGASSPLKLWPAERWAALAAALQQQGFTPVWSAGAKETALVAAVDPQGLYASYAGKLDLLQLAHLLRGAALLVCPDTGVAHLARLTGTPCVTLFGPGAADLCAASTFFRNIPTVALQVPIACRDQTVLFRRELAWVQRCGRGFGQGVGQCAQARCMEALGLEAVTAACLQLLK